MDKAFKAIFGFLHTATAHTTTAAGSTGVTLNLTAGGGAASGLAIGDMLAVDVSAAVGYEVRQVVNVVTDVITVDRGFTTDPAISRTVKVGTTFKLLNTSIISLYMKRWIAAAGYRLAVPGVVLSDMELSVDSAQATPVAKVSFSGKGAAELAHVEARPTFTFTGLPLAPQKITAWFDTGATPRKLFLAGAAALKVNNGLDLRDNESRSLNPTGAKRTANSSRYNVDLSLGMLLTTGDEDTTALYATAQAMTGLDVLVQLNNQAGMIVAFRCPKWIPEGTLGAREGEAGITLGGGRAYGTVGDDEVTLAFI
jgi:hypothetical protein